MNSLFCIMRFNRAVIFFFLFLDSIAVTTPPSRLGCVPIGTYFIQPFPANPSLILFVMDTHKNKSVRERADAIERLQKR